MTLIAIILALIAPAPTGARITEDYSYASQPVEVKPLYRNPFLFI